MHTPCDKKNCKRNIPPIEWKCRCEKKFCTKHRLPEKHNCLYNFKLSKLEKEKKLEELKCKTNNRLEIID
jgi:predicted nucleic acid binding AN1-type Zn finger protein